MPPRMGIMATKLNSLFTDDTSQITESDTECLFMKKELYTANVYRQTTDKLMFISVISTVR
jgi:hypothetical protein